ncbi:LemA family protein [Elusimicrobiota bacterium]
MSEIGDEVTKLYGGELVAKQLKPLTKPKIVAVMVLAVLLVLFFMSGAYYYNRFATLQQYCYASQGQIEKEFQRRADLIPRLVDVAKDYAGHEQMLFKYVADTHNLLQSVRKFDGAMGKISGSAIQKALSKLVALAERYPDLKATQSFQDLMDKLEITEDRVATARENYVESLRQYNTQLVTFPSSIFNIVFRFKSMGYYQSTQTASGSAREARLAQGEIK